MLMNKCRPNDGYVGYMAVAEKRLQFENVCEEQKNDGTALH